ncbi:uncharacterized protein LOC141878840 isoform X3 [Acropora palmata]|uniref:uncharacterized protein LOC141878840 isoform X3 n=1 Tax=Acropora palmata TaxID=6131 RepID=UPI003DA05702
MVWIQMLNKAYWISMGINFCFHWWDNCIFDCCYVSIIKENDSNTESYDLKSYFIFRVSFALLLLQMDVPEIQKRCSLQKTCGTNTKETEQEKKKETKHC